MKGKQNLIISLDIPVLLHWCRSKPLTAALSKPVFQSFFVFLGCYFFQQANIGYSKGWPAGNFGASMIRLRPTHLSDPTLPTADIKLSNFGLLHGDCRVSAQLPPTKCGNGTMVLHYTRPVVADGYFLVTSDLPPAFDPIGWAVEASDDEGRAWRMVGASVFRFTYGGVGFFYPDLVHQIQEARRMAIVVSHRRSWAWALSSIFGNLLSGCSFICVAAAGCSGREGLTTAVLVAMFGLRAAIYAAAAVELQATGAWRDAAERWLLVPEVLVPAIGLAMDEGLVVSLLFCYSLLGFLAKAVYVFGFYEVDLLFFLPDSSLLIYVIAFAFTTILAILRSRSLARAHELVGADKVQYDKMWTGILAHEVEAAALVEIQHEAQLLADAAAKVGASTIKFESCNDMSFHKKLLPVEQQLCTEVRTGVFCIGNSNSGIRQFCAGQNVDSLDQLFAQVISCLF